MRPLLRSSCLSMAIHHFEEIPNTDSSFRVVEAGFLSTAWSGYYPEDLLRIALSELRTAKRSLGYASASSKIPRVNIYADQAHDSVERGIKHLDKAIKEVNHKLVTEDRILPYLAGPTLQHNSIQRRTCCRQHRYHFL